MLEYLTFATALAASAASSPPQPPRRAKRPAIEYRMRITPPPATERDNPAAPASSPDAQKRLQPNTLPPPGRT
jgi:hypothetical protein